MSREDDEARLRAAGWQQRGSHWKAPWMLDGPDSWLNFDLAMAFLSAFECSESTRELARQAYEANEKRNAELAAMTPEDREKAIQEWAETLAADVADLND